jgi:predicted Holliday junction resolvase-like endonuclease
MGPSGLECGGRTLITRWNALSTTRWQKAPRFCRRIYNPRDARFIGSPIDIIVFNGLEDGVMHEIVFLEIKTGEGAALSQKQRQIRDAILDKRVVWLEFRI